MQSKACSLIKDKGSTPTAQDLRRSVDLDVGNSGRVDLTSLIRSLHTEIDDLERCLLKFRSQGDKGRLQSDLGCVAPWVNGGHSGPDRAVYSQGQAQSLGMLGNMGAQQGPPQGYVPVTSVPDLGARQVK